ncbi:MICOS complex subunit MIC12 [Microdochium nivale]|nr:MICOS complex subunit MIC12 [Microdochium nivale]
MGFTTGFTGGVTLTLGLAYLTVVAHQRNREQQAAILRQQVFLLSGVIDPLPPVLPPTRTELAALERANLVESAKDRWNAEIEGAVRWAQNKDWEEVQENVEIGLGRLWTRVTGGTEVVEARGQQAASIIKNDAAGVAAAAKSAYADAKAKTKDEAVTTKSSIFSAIGKGVQKAKEAVIGAEQKIEQNVMLATTPSGRVAPPDVENALKQRYEKPSGEPAAKSVEEALAERYTPVDKRDNTKLRAL